MELGNWIGIFLFVSCIGFMGWLIWGLKRMDDNPTPEDIAINNRIRDNFAKGDGYFYGYPDAMN